MTVHLISAYLIALLGLVIGIAAGLVVGAARARTLTRTDARLAIPLLLGAAGAHLILIGSVEPTRQLLFGLYGLALMGVVVFAAIGWSIWRLGGVVFPAGSIAGYIYFALPEHQADYVGLLIKVVELIAIVAVIVPVLRHERRRPRPIAA